MNKKIWSLIFIYLVIMQQTFSVPLPDLIPKDLKPIIGDDRDYDIDEKEILKRHVDSEEEEADPNFKKAYDQLYEIFNPKSNIEESRLKRFPQITEENVQNDKTQVKTQEIEKPQVTKIVEDPRSKRDKNQLEISQKGNEDLVGVQETIKSKKDVSSLFGSILPSHPFVELIGALLGSLANFFGGTAAGSLGALNDLISNMVPSAGIILNPILKLLASTISGLLTLAGNGASILLSSLGGIFGSQDGGKSAAESLVKGTSTGAKLIQEIMQSKDEQKKLESIAKSFLKS